MYATERSVIRCITEVAVGVEGLLDAKLVVQSQMPSLITLCDQLAQSHRKNMSRVVEFVCKESEKLK
jgi:hypothetical protein